MTVEDLEKGATAKNPRIAARTSDHGPVDADQSPDGEKKQNMAAPAEYTSFASSQRSVSMLGWGLVLTLGAAGWFLLLALIR